MHCASWAASGRRRFERRRIHRRGAIATLVDLFCLQQVLHGGALLAKLCEFDLRRFTPFIHQRVDLDALFL